MTLDRLSTAVSEHGLMLMGAFHPDKAEGMAQDAGTIVLLGPSPDFWPIFKSSPEFTHPDPIDRWSTRVITSLANRFDAVPVFPFGGPPYAPFLRWAKLTGRAWDSPVGMLVHDTTGLMVSYRGALLFSEPLDLPGVVPAKPCDTCSDRPCLTACPVAALGQNGYDIPVCTAFLDTDAGKDCMNRGCHVRRSCPASRGAGRHEDQSAHHMRIFRGNR